MQPFSLLTERAPGTPGGAQRHIVLCAQNAGVHFKPRAHASCRAQETLVRQVWLRGPVGPQRRLAVATQVARLEVAEVETAVATPASSKASALCAVCPISSVLTHVLLCCQTRGGNVVPSSSAGWMTHSANARGCYVCRMTQSGQLVSTSPTSRLCTDLHSCPACGIPAAMPPLCIQEVTALEYELDVNGLKRIKYAAEGQWVMCLLTTIHHNHQM